VTVTENEWQTEQFELNRAHLMGVAQRMLGSAAEAEDAVQEAWLRVTRADADDVRNMRGWLTTIVSRICLDMLRARQARREDLTDGWRAEPILAVQTGSDPEQEALMADSVGLALLVVLESLSPVERLAFVLHDMFGVSFEEIAPIVERSVPATRQLASRARRRVRGAGEPEVGDRVRQERVVEAFLEASRDGDFEALLKVLDPDVVFRGDAGTTGLPVPVELHGADRVAQLVLARGTPSAPLGRPAIVNGRPGAIVVRDGALVAAVAFTIRADRVVAMDLVLDPAKLTSMRV
jgi:RNA polymerase sigma-70 factor (ECF subfamily)